ncbi:MAG: glutaminyl-peptide cyclotransferase [Anaerolineae bacterium]
MKKSCHSLLLCLVLTLVNLPVLAQTSTPSAPEATAESTPDPNYVELLLPEVISTRPHATDAWTEGLLLFDGFLYESIGENGQSALRKVDPQTGNIVQELNQPADDYAEGLALVDDRFIQLTWKQEIAYVYDRDTFKQLDTFNYTGEGWGLSYDGEAVWMSNGSDTLVTRDPKTFEIIREIPITLFGKSVAEISSPQGQSLGGLNELEVVGDEVYSNIWPTAYALRIDKATGIVTGIIDGTKLLAPDEKVDPAIRNYLNGIAYDADTDTFLITGKYWPKLFEVQWKVADTLRLQ